MKPKKTIESIRAARSSLEDLATKCLQSAAATEVTLRVGFVVAVASAVAAFAYYEAARAGFLSLLTN